MTAGRENFSEASFLSGPELLKDAPSPASLFPVTSFSPRFAEILRLRGLTHPEKIEAFLDAGIRGLEDPFLMKGMREAVAQIRQAVSSGQKILIHGDYDVDGITGAAIVGRTLQKLKADFSIFLPERKRDGYGVSGEAIRGAHAGGVSLVITVDCGICAREEITAARALGLDVIVIDHHRIPAGGLPPATVILNPLQENCEYPFKELSAGGLAFKLSQALLGELAYPLLDLAALSTVCDVAPLVGENRVLVKNGLKILSARTNPGVRALAEKAGIKSREVNAGHVGFMLGPRINAAGRMSSADIALRLLLTDQAREAESLAEVLNEENKMRQKEERQVLKEAIAEVERTVHFNRERVIVVARNGWHAGVIGIVASRLVERFHRPAIVVALENGIGKGSGRSIKNFHLFNALESSRKHLEEFGGHEQAAGLNIREENLPGFRKAVNEYASQNYAPEIFVRKISYDLELALGEFKNHFLQELKLLEPHGAGNPCPVFLTRGLEVRNGPERLSPTSVKFWITDGAMTFEAVCPERSGVEDLSGLAKGARVDLIYSIKTKVWDGVETLSLEIKEMRPADYR